MKMESCEIRRIRRLTALMQKQKPDGLDDYFVEIAQHFRPYIQALAFSMLQDRDRAEDIASEALCKAYIHLHGFAPEDRENLKAKAWLAEITRNLCIDYQKKGKEASLEDLLEAGYPLIAHPYSNPENRALYADEAAILTKGLNSLTARERGIIRRFFQEGESGSDIAKSLGISRSGVYVIIHRALKRLRHPENSRMLVSYWLW